MKRFKTLYNGNEHKNVQVNKYSEKKKLLNDTIEQDSLNEPPTTNLIKSDHNECKIAPRQHTFDDLDVDFNAMTISSKILKNGRIKIITKCMMRKQPVH